MQGSYKIFTNYLLLNYKIVSGTTYISTLLTEHFNSSLPLLREYGIKEKSKLLPNNNGWDMVKAWITLELLHFMSLSVKKIRDLFKAFTLSY